MIIFNRKAFSLIEIMIVVAVIAIALSIAIPNFFRMSTISKTTVCINNLRKITAAVEQWVIDNNMSSGTTITEQQEEDIYDNYLRSGRPKCPSDGEYVINSVGSNPQVQCTNEEAGHKI
ncbi:MAG: prepilin-type N-terminal cleavage/methylation domain-containing protein [Candidatus Omnitrophota bacterium]